MKDFYLRELIEYGKDINDTWILIARYAGEEIYTRFTPEDFESFGELSKRSRTAKADRNRDKNNLRNLIGRGSGAEDTDSVKKSLQTTDADYLSAVERGDMETAQRMVNDAA